MCFWNCLAYHEIKNKRCANKGKELYEQFYGTKPNKDYPGFDIVNELEQFELNTNKYINIFEMTEDNKFNYVRKSDCEDNCINLLLYQNHFCYINKLETITGMKFNCNNCGHQCACISDLKKHLKTCDDFEKKDVFCKYPTIYEPERNLIIQLNEIFDCNCDFRYKYLIVYDFESLCTPTGTI